MKQLPLTLLLLLTFPVIAIGQSVKSKKKKVKPDVILITQFGEMGIKLYEETPEHRANFLKLASEGFYDGTTFHRVIKDFMIQGGDPYSKDSTTKGQAGTGGPGYTLSAEIIPGLIHSKGKLSAARQGDQVNPERRSSGSQFYIVQGRSFSEQELKRAEQQISMVTKSEFHYSDEQMATYEKQGGSPWLDQQYTIFGEVIYGMDVIDMIANVETLPGDRPSKDIAIKMECIAKVKKTKNKKDKEKMAKKKDKEKMAKKKDEEKVAKKKGKGN